MKVCMLQMDEETTDVSQPGTSSGTSNFETEKEKFYKRKFNEMKEKESVLQKKLDEYEATKKPKIEEFQDQLLENENFLNSVKRRLTHQRKNHPWKINATVKKIISEANGFLKEDIMDLLTKISGQNWPDEVLSCLDYNTGRDNLGIV